MKNLETFQRRLDGIEVIVEQVCFQHLYYFYHQSINKQVSEEAVCI